jgi:hypothetical protein
VIDEGNHDVPSGFICSSSIHIYNVYKGTCDLVLSRFNELPELPESPGSSQSFAAVCVHADSGKLFAGGFKDELWAWDLGKA